MREGGEDEENVQDEDAKNILFYEACSTPILINPRFPLTTPVEFPQHSLFLHVTGV